MRFCKKCQRIFADDMNYCPYCGEKYHDYKEDIESAMDDFDESERKISEEKKSVPIVENEQPAEKKTVFITADTQSQENRQNFEMPSQQPIQEIRMKFDEAMEKQHMQKKEKVSRTAQQEKLREEKENALLNKILTGLVVALVVVILGGGFMIAKHFFSRPSSDSDNPPVVNEPKPNTPEQNNPQETDQPAPEPVPQPEPDSTTETPVVEIPSDDEITGNMEVEVTDVSVSRQDGMVRVEIKCKSSEEGEVYLSDGGSLNIGPIRVGNGTGSFYYLLNPTADRTYTLTFISSDKTKNATYTITGDQILKGLE